MGTKMVVAFANISMSKVLLLHWLYKSVITINDIDTRR